MKPGPPKLLKVYADTSVFGGVFDVEFQRHSMEFFREVHRGYIELCLSTLIEKELRGAPKWVWDAFLPHRRLATPIDITPQALALQEAYLAAGIVSSRSEADALHVALASVEACDFIVSWNFKHIVHAQKVPLYNAVNRLNGYGEIRIHAPPEVTRHDEDQDF